MRCSAAMCCSAVGCVANRRMMPVLLLAIFSVASGSEVHQRLMKETKLFIRLAKLQKRMESSCRVASSHFHARPKTLSQLPENPARRPGASCASGSSEGNETPDTMLIGGWVGTKFRIGLG